MTVTADDMRWYLSALDDLSDLIDEYIATLLWSSVNLDYVDGVDASEMMDGVDAEPSEDMRAAIAADITDFLTQHEDDVVAYCVAGTTASDPSRALGYVMHDFVLTRNSHGAGFWDRGLGYLGDRLARAAKSYGEMTPYVGDDGEIHVA